MYSRCGRERSNFLYRLMGSAAVGSYRDIIPCLSRLSPNSSSNKTKRSRLLKEPLFAFPALREYLEIALFKT